jgi:hypothetical protein
MIGQAEMGSTNHITFITLFFSVRLCYAFTSLRKFWAKRACLDFSSSTFQMESHILSTGGITLRVPRWLGPWRSSRRLGRISKPTRPGWVQFESRERERVRSLSLRRRAFLGPDCTPPASRIISSSGKSCHRFSLKLIICRCLGCPLPLISLRFLSALLPPQATEIRLLQVFTRSLSQGLLYQHCLLGSSVSQSHTFTSEDNERTLLMFCMCDMDMDM